METKDKDFQKMIHRIAFTALLFGFIFACVYAYNTFQNAEKRNRYTYTASDTLRIRSKEALLHTVVIRYQVQVNRGKMNERVRSMFDANSNTFMKYIVFNRIHDNLQRDVFESVYFTPDSVDIALTNLSTAVNKSFNKNLSVNHSGISITLLEYHLYLDPVILNYIEKKRNFKP